MAPLDENWMVKQFFCHVECICTQYTQIFIKSYNEGAKSSRLAESSTPRSSRAADSSDQLNRFLFDGTCGTPTGASNVFKSCYDSHTLRNKTSYICNRFVPSPFRTSHFPADFAKTASLIFFVISPTKSRTNRQNRTHIKLASRRQPPRSCLAS